MLKFDTETLNCLYILYQFWDVLRFHIPHRIPLLHLIIASLALSFRFYLALDMRLRRE